MNDMLVKNLTPARHGWRCDTGNRKSGRQWALSTPFTHQRPDKLSRARKLPTLPCPFASQTSNIQVGNGSSVKQKRGRDFHSILGRVYPVFTPIHPKLHNHLQPEV